MPFHKLLKAASASMFVLALLMASGVKAHPPRPGACSPSNRAACEYVSDLAFTDIREIRFVLVDPNRNNYRLPVLIRYPFDAPGPRPVIIWNHGGAPRAGGREGSAEWSNALARAGYIVIHPSRNLIDDPAPYQAQCNANGAPTPDGCVNWVSHSLFGPLNTDFLISRFHVMQVRFPELVGRFNNSKVAVGGWSAGTTVALANAGAWRQFTPSGPFHYQSTPTPEAFMAVAPFGPDYAGFNYAPTWNFGGFQTSSFDTIDDRPFLFVTGMGDYGPKTFPDKDVASEARTFAWQRSTAGNKFLSWAIRPSASHGTMNISDCGTAIKQIQCNAIESLGLAYFDAVLRQRQVAIDWLATDAHRLFSNGLLEFRRR